MSKQKESNYDGSQIQVLEGLEPVRKRPGMYIGSTGYEGVHHLIKEIADNSIDEAIAGYGTKVIVRILADGGVNITDDGRGIPIDIHPKTGKSTLETVLTILHELNLNVEFQQLNLRSLEKPIAKMEQVLRFIQIQQFSKKQLHLIISGL